MRFRVTSLVLLYRRRQAGAPNNVREDCFESISLRRHWMILPRRYTIVVREYPRDVMGFLVTSS